MDNKRVHVFGGGTVSYLASHLATCAPAYGTTAKKLFDLCQKQFDKMDVCLHLTKMAGGHTRCWTPFPPPGGRLTSIENTCLETNEDISDKIDELIGDDRTKVIFMTAALVDYGRPKRPIHPDAKYEDRHSTKDTPTLYAMLEALPKVITKIRKTRKDIFLVAFKQTCGKTADEQYIEGLDLCKRASANLVLANDVKTRLNMVITPEEARYHVTTDRGEALAGLVEMAKLRSHLTFTRSTVVAGEPIPWSSPMVPSALRTVVDYCINQGAYKPFNGATVGHFACKVDENTFLTSIRKSNFNDLHKIGLVKVITDGPDSVMAYGAKPSVGGQSQRIVFHEHQDYDCIVHFHSPIKEGSKVPVASQREVECGSHQCGANTSNNLKRFGNLSAVYLDNHGPNIVFHRSIDPQEVIDFIEQNFDLSQKTGGFVSLKSRLETPNTLETAKQLL